MALSIAGRIGCLSILDQENRDESVRQAIDRNSHSADECLG
jgi:hypothetical protein